MNLANRSQMGLCHCVALNERASEQSFRPAGRREQWKGRAARGVSDRWVRSRAADAPAPTPPKPKR